MAFAEPLALPNNLMMKALERHLLESLREHFRTAAEPIIDEIAQKAVKEFEIEIQNYRELCGFRDVIEIIVRKDNDRT